MRGFDYSPFYRATVGFDRVFDLLDNVAGQTVGNGYPPYNIEKAGDNAYRIVMAVAGFVEGEDAGAMRHGEQPERSLGHTRAPDRSSSIWPLIAHPPGAGLLKVFGRTANPFAPHRIQEIILFSAFFDPLEGPGRLPRLMIVSRAHPGAATSDIAH